MAAAMAPNSFYGVGIEPRQPQEHHNPVNGHGGSGQAPHFVEVPFFGYNSRVFPCLNGTATCDYLTSLYVGHIEGMLFTGLIWMTIIVIFVLWAIVRCIGRPKSSPPGVVRTDSGAVRLRRTLGAFFRRRLLQQAARPVFGRATRLQVLVLGMLAAYLTLWSFIGIIYGKWKTPVEGHPELVNTRTSLAPWADRVGVLTYALTPFLILLGSRESLLSLMSGLPYQSFNFLHRWVGYIVFAQGLLHTVGWTVIEVGLYQPQPQVARDWIRQKYMIGGCAAMVLLTVMVALSTTWGIRMTGYEFFRKSHYVFAIAYFAACVVHWHKLEIFMAPSLILWLIDRGIRLIRSALIHFQRLPSGRLGFRSATATMTTFPDEINGDVIRLDFENQQKTWPVGKHFYLCFSELSIWQSHPFTPINFPVARNGVVKHSYVMRARSGATGRLATLAKKKLSDVDFEDASDLTRRATTSVIATGPYGEDFLKRMTNDTNVICIAGGTGVTAVLSTLLDLAQQTPNPDRKIEFIWAMRHSDNAKWVQEELDSLRKASGAHNMAIRLYATRDRPETSSSQDDTDEKKAREVVDMEEMGSSSSREGPPPCGSDAEMSIRKMGVGAADTDRRPDLGRLVNDFIASTVRGPTTVFASGPGNMIGDLRTIVAAHNDASKVWRNETRYSVRLVCDDRLER